MIKTDIFVLFLILGKAFVLFPLSVIDGSCGFFTDAFYLVEEVLFYF